MKNIMFIHLYLIGFYILCITQRFACEICSTCLCLTAINEGPIIDCHGKDLENNDMLIADLLTLNGYRSLNKLILSNNNISNLPEHLLKKLKPVKSLDLSENLMETIHTSIFIDLSNLEDLNLSKNKLTVFDDSLLKVLPTLLTLNVSHNHIHTVESVADKTTVNIIYLTLSHNNISSLPKKFFELLPNLQYLDLSFNRIHSLMDYSLTRLNSLKMISINNNFLTSLDIRIFPKSLIKLHSGHNQIAEIFYESSQLKVLNIEYNNISEIYKNITKLNELTDLNVAGNTLYDFPNTLLKNLRKLDLSNNKLQYIPESLSVQNFPLLLELNVSKNPIQNLTFRSDLQLHSFIASNISTLKTIDKDTFTHFRMPPTDCIRVTISNNEMLSFIHEDALKHLKLCFLDLRNNRLSYVSQELVMNSDTSVVLDINLQGNPFKCNCSLQWMLNDLIPSLYFTRPDLLDNLRCAWPPQISNIRMVHWYGWKEQIFCNMSNLNENLIMKVDNVVDKKVTFESSTGWLIVMGIALTVLSSLIIIGIIWTQKIAIKKRRINRKF
ncbi:uncharacterized protein LOC117602999 [Osmia lignaria lignaria]|uniref:uncharacterized protein LOC117602999 n=1 Tax=Osmia lignaria lignaria TaxID=1437193 RepID=UPI00402B5F3C